MAAIPWRSPEPPAAGGAPVPGLDQLPILPAADTVSALTQGAAAAATVPVLMRWIRDRRWFRSRTRHSAGLTVRDVVPVPMEARSAAVLLAEMTYTVGDPELYLIPLAILGMNDATAILEASPQAAIGRIASATGPKRERLLVDAALDPAFMTAVLDAIGAGRRFRGRHGELAGRPEKTFQAVVGSDLGFLVPTPIRGEQSNSSTIFGDRAILKLYRVTQPGINPDLEVGRMLTKRGFAQTPAIAGSMEYRPDEGQAMTAVLVSGFVPNEGNLFRHTLEELGGFFERSTAGARRVHAGDLDPAGLLTAAGMRPPVDVRKAIGPYLETAHLAGIRTGEMHQTLAGVTDDPSFAPEAFSVPYQRSLYQSIGGSTRRAMDLLARRIDDLPEGAAREADQILADRTRIDRHLQMLLSHAFGGLRIRTHGDLHAEQILYTGHDLAIIDFEGEPTRPLAERRLKRSALRDVAGMLRSFHYASYGSLLRPEMGVTIRPEDVEDLAGWVMTWNQWVGASFLAGYRAATQGAAFLPTDDADRATLLRAFMLEKACYELVYELNNRPSWALIPIRGILQLLEG
ncbi:MAG: putative maltokinase [Chloroflexota bacterium]